jgi:hypothetical protein
MKSFTCYITINKTSESFFTRLKTRLVTMDADYFSFISILDDCIFTFMSYLFEFSIAIGANVFVLWPFCNAFHTKLVRASINTCSCRFLQFIQTYGTNFSLLFLWHFFEFLFTFSCLLNYLRLIITVLLKFPLFVSIHVRWSAVITLFGFLFFGLVSV